jgi:DNA-binding GntR family transcriptional regulator
VHRKLRNRILTGELRPGSVLLQARLARELGVSRTPLREAFRLLQREGLIEARPDQRARVLGVDAEALDSTYATRILLESTAVAVTTATADERLAQTLHTSLARMRHLAATDRAPGDAWFEAHRAFHAQTTQGAPRPMSQQMELLREHSQRYVRIDGWWHHDAVARADAEHQALVEAITSRDAPEAVRVIAHHLARTALSVLAGVNPSTDPVAIRTAVRLVTNGEN